MIPPAIVVLSFATSARSQSFEVASIKPNTSDNGRSSTRPGPTELYLENMSLRKCIALAYNVSEDRDNAISAPDWLNFARYDIAAKYPPGTPLEQVRVMLQNLLADRFKLKLHRESKELTIYALVTATVAELNEDYIAKMEDVLEVYERPYNPQEPVVCLDEKPVTLHADVRPASPAKPGREARQDNEYERRGTANIFCAVEPKAGRHFTSVTPDRSGFEFAKVAFELALRYPQPTRST